MLPTCKLRKDHRLGGWTVEGAIVLLFFINLVNYVDRGIVPGANKEFLHFIGNSVKTDSPDVYLGLLQSAFIIGFSIASIIFGHLVHHYPPFRLVGAGMSIWTLAAVMSGAAQHIGSYEFLLFARMLSGVGEASFQCVGPPFIEDVGGDAAGRWLALFYTAIPVGTAMGYPYGAMFAGSELGWAWAFWLEALVMLPIALGAFFLPFKWRPEKPVVYTEVTTTAEDGARMTSRLMSNAISDDEGREDGAVASRPATRDVTIMEELRAIICKPIFLLIVLGYAANTGFMIGVSTFGSALLLEFGYYQKESTASTVFGASLALGGMLGTPLGGFLIDSRQHRHKADKLAYITRQIFIFASLGMIMSCLSCFMETRGLFLFTFVGGALLLFVCTAGINYGILLAVPAANRSFAIALDTLCIHALGDVPSPIIVGALLDRLAPECAADLKASGGGGDFVLSPECRAQLPEVRFTLFLTCLYLTVTVVCFGAAWVLATRGARAQGDRRDGEEEVVEEEEDMVTGRK